MYIYEEYEVYTGGFIYKEALYIYIYMSSI